MAGSLPVIDLVDFDEMNKGVLVTVNFNLPVSVLRHFPDNSGNQVDITILPIANTAEQKESIEQPQRLSYEATQNSPLQLIRYEPDNTTGKVISLIFSRNTSFEILSQTNPQEIRIKLANDSIRPVIRQDAALNIEEVNATPSVDTKEFIYTINLLSSRKPITLSKYQTYIALQNYHVYTTQTVIPQGKWYRLRAGFFSTRTQAQQASQSLKSKFPNAWIDKATGPERKQIEHWLLAQNKSTTTKQTTQKNQPVITDVITTPESQLLLSRAKKNIIEGKYRKAILLLTKLLNLPANASSEIAQELIGVAREKNQQLAHAIAEYRTYLKKYPNGKYAKRVQQRLDGLINARSGNRKKLRKAKTSEDSQPWQVYGTIFQFFRRDVDTTESNNTVLNSSLDTDLSVSARKRTQNLDIRTRFTGSYSNDFEDGTQNDFRISSLYIDTADRSRNWNARLGRQNQNNSGILGRFDGISAGYRLSPKWKINAVAGFPVVLSSTNQLQTDKVLYGMSLDAGTFDKYWNVNTYLIKQTADGLDDRTAVGTEVRYLHPKTTVFALLDYDIDYNSVNIAQVIANARLPYDTSVNLVADYRNGPILTTSNALQGQTSTTLDELLLTYTEDEIRQLAEDRTIVFRSLSGTLSKQMTNNLQISLDVAASHLESSPASGGVDATPSTGIEYFYGTQLIANSIFKEGDTSLFGLRYADTSSSDTLTFSVNSRYPYNKSWRLNPRFRIDKQKRDNNSTILRYRPSFKMDYRAKREIRLEMEIGYELSDIDDAFGSREESNYFIYMGYIADF
jgi:hypothetical protein